MPPGAGDGSRFDTGRQDVDKEVNVNLTQEKKCSRCGQTKPRAEFGPRRETSDGLMYTCRPCTAEKARKRYLDKNKNKVLTQRPRRPLPAAANTAGWSLRKDVERLERIFADDRFTTHKQQVAAQLGGHLKYAAEVCQDLFSRLDQIEGD